MEKNMRLLLSLLLLLLLPVSSIQAATVVGSFSGLSPSAYSDIWKVAYASPQPLIMDDLSGDDDLRGLYTGNITALGCELYVSFEWGDAAGVYSFVETGTIVTINGIPVGVVEVDLSPLRCLVAYNFSSFGPIESSSEPEEEETPAPPVCVETDGGFAPYATGTMTHTFPSLPSPVTDTCVAGGNLQEYYCNSSLYDGSHVAQTSCPNGCEDGRCLYASEVEESEEPSEVVEPEPECADSDGGFDQYTQGTMTLGEQVQEESCSDAETLVEYSCNGTSWTTDQQITWTCANGCVQGRCLTDDEVAMGPDAEEEIESEQEAIFTSCADSDFGLAPHTLGTLTLIATESELTTEGQEINQSDECLDANQVVELYCDSRATQLFGYQFVDCPAGCFDGACASGVCQETDDGYDRYTGGQMEHQYALLENPAVDYCSSPTKLVEYACGYNLADNNPLNDNQQSSICAYGCVTDDEGQGRCQTFIETLNPLNIVQTLSAWLSWLLNLLGGN